MKAVLVLLLLLFALPALASESNGTLPTQASEASISESRFHLITMKCEPEASEGPETTPQSPPLNVDDPGTPGCNRWEINVVADGDLTQSQNIWEVPRLDINYGIGDNLQLKYEIPYLSAQTTDAGDANAVGESTAGVKFMFFEDEASKTQMAVYPQLTFVGDNSDVVQKGLATNGKIYTLPVLLTTKLGQTSRGDINMTANVGYNISTKFGTADYVSAAIGVGMPLMNRIGMMGELSTEQGVALNSDAIRDGILKADVGAIGTLTKQIFLFGSIGHSLVSSYTNDHTYALLGFRVLAGGM